MRFKMKQEYTIKDSVPEFVEEPFLMVPPQAKLGPLH